MDMGFPGYAASTILAHIFGEKMALPSLKGGLMLILKANLMFSQKEVEDLRAKKSDPP